ncbi:hypothetical protein QUF84_14870 [Fictibacillus enclensis]|uniref:hypothetical protein n=1 Tax=Fictibacillus enclensis TaxID=1017270 RepID=UPI0025A0A2B9|nr:hypothetical protein [Fictibacillus enclensis]MDM5338497.1 hypothetical protein [Fictibacillus enclensis]
MKKLEVYFPYIILLSVTIIDLIIFYAVMKTLNVFEKEIIAAIIGFLGSIFGGLLTLVGVKWTLNSQFKIYEQEKFERANYIFTILLPLITEVYNAYKSVKTKSFYEDLDNLKKKALKLEKKASELSELAAQTQIEFFREVKGVEYYAGVIQDYIMRNRLKENAGKLDKEIMEDLKRFYSGLAKADNKLFSLINKMKPSHFIISDKNSFV